jgi:hypothetical protein
MANSSTTRISDLPENITVQMPNHGFGANRDDSPRNTVITNGPSQNLGPSQQGLGQNTYMPMNVHPNPYGPPASGEMPFPQNVHEGSNAPTMQEQRLPSRDIPMNQDEYLHDEQVHANYIPKPPPSAVDYIRKYEETEGKNIRVHEERKHRKLVAEDWMSQMQIPIFVAILYFIFQMPIFNTLLSKYLSALPMFREDGNLNLYGMVFKSAGFGLLYYGVEYALDYFA